MAKRNLDEGPTTRQLRSWCAVISRSRGCRNKKDSKSKVAGHSIMKALEAAEKYATRRFDTKLLHLVRRAKCTYSYEICDLNDELEQHANVVRFDPIRKG